MATLHEWIEGARPRTLPAALAPVLLGTACAYAVDAGHLGRAALALVVALALQVGVNYANDYSDGIRGTDENRTGPVRLVGQGLAPAAHVKRAAFASFGVAALAGLLLVALCGAWWLLLVGAVSVVAAWFYTGGRRPYGYLGLGEIFVFVFFGLVATLGTTYTQADTTTLASWAAATGVGLLSCAILMVNNVRDIPTDGPAGKRTLAVRLGERRARLTYVGMLVAAFVACAVAAVQHPGALVGLLVAPLAVRPCKDMLGGATGRGLIPALGATGKLTLAYAVAVAVGIGVVVFPTMS
ncbi:1,4-dihydroxy-2-naphthoate polyprenyltransferase [Mobilicoccus pelagius]|uniref:1,4-dihydroxy-2-naphthoate octaprenyltransferase n=1 Tax=Mobilicoccus pelagius NBRC 104925 TaxID=1089455 RepID=H5US18_9MICO|nr:1,4-dihydroxy-2-naphthoate polyprenyltransferase [Mobilicoccus pelagius]GAB48526.1 1,4-dihydroxy-2-naphthoate octaprenyltransferase [Mobilicoccus pelagius NBRC 104925]